jgi:hypothetical protein
MKKDLMKIVPKFRLAAETICDSLQLSEVIFD